MFVRKHYVAVAEVIRYTKTRQGLVEQLIELFEDDNPRFNEYRFRKRAGLEG